MEKVITKMLIAVRESLEMLLVIVLLPIYVSKIGQKDLRKYIYYGGATGIVLSIGWGVFLFDQAKNLDTAFQQVFQGVMMIFLAI